MEGTIQHMPTVRRGSRLIKRELDTMKITIRRLEERIAALESGKPQIAETTQLQEPPKKRKRRTKAEMEAARAQMEETHAESVGSE